MFYGIKYFSIKDRNRTEIPLGIKVKKGWPFVRKIVPNRINSQYFHSIFLKTGRMLFPSSTITLRTIRKSYGSLVPSYREHIHTLLWYIGVDFSKINMWPRIDNDLKTRLGSFDYNFVCGGNFEAIFNSQIILLKYSQNFKRTSTLFLRSITVLNKTLETTL